MPKTRSPSVLGSGRVLYLPTARIRPNPMQPRKHFDTGGLQELAGSIRQYGVLQPLTVRKAGGAYELVAGERRLRAARLAGLTEVPCLLADVDEEASGMLALVENLQREDLNPIEEAKGYRTLMEDYGLSEAFFKEIDSSVKKNCKNQNDIKTYFFMFQGFCNDLFNLLGNLMQWKFRFSMLVKKLLYNMTTKTVHDILTKSEWKDISVQKAAWSVRKYAEKLGYSEQWITDFVYNVVLLAKEDQKKELKKSKEA